MNFVLVKQEHTCNPSAPWKIEKKKLLKCSFNRSFIFINIAHVFLSKSKETEPHS